ncbi:thioester reductase domain-containing protein [Aureivirga sp. CE67]|uniref:thioester reductase domain-containing protein n=1 Tax=Aureivirga sp. CE67 TaxID=1788983 RepID=UPI0018CA4499|nr:thioester reductase domain-containing protein [Aureivirga sp. CE67]
MKNQNVYTVLAQRLSHYDGIMTSYLKNGKWKDLSYAQMIQNVEKSSVFLKKAGVEPTMRIGILMKSSPDWIQACYSVLKLNAIAVLLNEMGTADEVSQQIRKMDLSLIICDTPTYEKYKGKLPNEIAMLLLEENKTEFIEEFARPKEVVQPRIRDGKTSEAIVILTSGTSGNSKGVIISHDALIHQLTSVDFLPDIKTPVFSVLPFFHVFPLVALVFLGPFSHARIVLIDTLSLEAITKAFKDQSPRLIISTPRLLEAIYMKVQEKLEHLSPLKKNVIHVLNELSFNFSRKLKWKIGRVFFKEVIQVFGGELIKVICGGAPIGRKLTRFYEGCGIEIHIGYGMSETTGPITYSPADCRRIGAVGTPIHGVELRISNPDSFNEGEVMVRGPIVMDGYFRDEELTNQTIKKGWLYTGDIGSVHKNHFLYLTGRAKELIVSATGKKTSPDEIEIQFKNLPYVEDFAAVGISQNDDEGDEVFLAVVLNEEEEIEKQKKALEREILNRNETLPHRLQVKEIFYTAIIPRTSILKVKRKKLTEQILQSLNTTEEKIETINSTKENLDHVTTEIVQLLEYLCKNTYEEGIWENKHLSEFGLDSLMSIQFYNLLKEKFPEKVRAEWIYANPTVKELSETIQLGKPTFKLKKIEEQEELYEFKGIRWRKNAEKQIPYKTPSLKNIFITGATGVLGGHVMLNLLKNTDVTVYCLSREKEKEKAFDRITSLLEVYQISKEEFEAVKHRIHIILGDVSSENFGLNNVEYEQLCNIIDATIHSAAKVSLHGIYEELYDINVLGTKNCIEFALKTKTKRMIHVSTYSIYGDAIYTHENPLTEEYFDIEQKFENMGYQQTKFEAEILVRASSRKGLKWSIVRPGDIYGDSKTGAYPLYQTTVTGIYYDILKTVIKTRNAMESSRYFDITPVDFVSNSIVFLLFKYPFVYGTYHLKNGNITKYNDVLALIKSIGFDFSVLKQKEYMKKVLENDFKDEHGKEYNSMTLDLLKLHPEEMEVETKTYVDATKTSSLLSFYEIECEAPSKNLFQTYFKYCQDVNYLNL